MVNDKELPAHRLIVGAESKFLEKLMFGQNFMEANQKKIQIDAPLKAFEILLRFMYGMNVTLDENELDDVFDLLELTHRFDMKRIQGNAVTFLERNMTSENVLEILSVAQFFDIKELIMSCGKMIDKTHERVFFSNKLGSATISDIVLALHAPHKIEEAVKVYVVAQWIYQHPEITKEAKDFILSHMDTKQLDSKTILKTAAELKCFDLKMLLDYGKEAATEEFLRSLHSEQSLKNNNRNRASRNGAIHWPGSVPQILGENSDPPA